MEQFDGPEPDWLQVARYLSGRSSEIERQRLMDWAHDGPDHQQSLDRVERIWEAAGDPMPDGRVDEKLLRDDWRKLRARMRSST